jgi:hypothetical protein
MSDRERLFQLRDRLLNECASEKADKIAYEVEVVAAYGTVEEAEEIVKAIRQWAMIGT